jgi:transposase
MSFIAKQKIKGNIYLYRVESYWDSEKKQSRQKRTYLGPENRKYSSKKIKKAEIVHKKYGNVFLLQKILEETEIEKVVQNLFPNNYNEIIALAFYQICSGEPMYLFPQWLHEQSGIDSKSLHSAEISSLCESIGTSQIKLQNFFQEWIKIQDKNMEIYYDITSISSYSTNIEFIEWGYNRDKEKLPQLNMGIACTKNGTPLFYQTYPGSIPDVKTLKNILKLLTFYNIDNATIILDRGFCSKANILEMNKLKDKIKFIQPMTFSMKKTIDVLKSNRKKLKKINSAIKYKEEILHYTNDSIDLDDTSFNAHLFYNEKIETDLRNDLLSKLLEIFAPFKDRKFTTMKDYLEFRNAGIPEKYRNFFKINREENSIELNHRNINSYLIKSGYFILLSNSDKLNKTNILEHYRDRDIVEKLFEIEKNDLDSSRLRAHTQYNSDGRLFIKFIALILYNKISTYMKKNKLFDCYSLKEVLKELSKIRCSIYGKETVLSEVSKTQRKILKAFDLLPEMLEKHSY